MVNDKLFRALSLLFLLFQNYLFFKYPILPLYYWALTSLLTSLLGSYIITHITTLLLHDFFVFLAFFFCCCRPLCFITNLFLSEICHVPLFCRALLHVVLFVCHPYFHKLLSLLHSFIAAGKPHSADFVDEF